jgi:hypothetical protein
MKNSSLWLILLKSGSMRCIWRGFQTKVEVAKVSQPMARVTSPQGNHMGMESFFSRSLLRAIREKYRARNPAQHDGLVAETRKVFEAKSDIFAQKPKFVQPLEFSVLTILTLIPSLGISRLFIS